MLAAVGGTFVFGAEVICIVSHGDGNFLGGMVGRHVFELPPRHGGGCLSLGSPPWGGCLCCHPAMGRMLVTRQPASQLAKPHACWRSCLGPPGVSLWEAYVPARCSCSMGDRSSCEHAGHAAGHTATGAAASGQQAANTTSWTTIACWHRGPRTTAPAAAWSTRDKFLSPLLSALHVWSSGNSRLAQHCVWIPGIRVVCRSLVSDGVWGQQLGPIGPSSLLMVEVSSPRVFPADEGACF